MRELPLFDASAAIGCTIGDTEVPERIALLERMRASLSSMEETEHGIVLRFPPDEAIEAEVRRFAVDEKRCCRFWGFEVAVDAGGVALRWDAPPGARDVLERIGRFFTGAEPASTLKGLL